MKKISTLILVLCSFFGLFAQNEGKLDDIFQLEDSDWE